MTTTPRVKPSRFTFSITTANAERFRNARSQVQARMQLELGRSVSFEEVMLAALERMGEVAKPETRALPVPTFPHPSSDYRPF